MSRWAPTHAGSAAQPRGAPAFYINLRAANDDLRLPRDHHFFICAHTPARWEADIAVPPGITAAHGPGVAVLWFCTTNSARTAKPLKTRGSMVLLYRPSRDVRAGAGARTCREIPQNQRTIEPEGRNGGNLPFMVRQAVLRRFYGSGPNKIGGGYASAARMAPSRPDQHPIAGGARERFWGWIAVGGFELGRHELRGLVERNGGFLRFSSAPIGRVGIPMLECAQKIEIDQRLADVHRKPAGLRCAVAEAPRGSRADRPPQPPLCADRLARLMLALDVARNSGLILSLDSLSTAGRGQPSEGGDGSGLGRLPVLAVPVADRAVQMARAERVRDRGTSWRRAKCRAETATLWGACADVN